jgi:hypothetical protein
MVCRTDTERFAALEAMSLDIASLEARRAVVGGIYPVAATLNWPD